MTTRTGRSIDQQIAEAQAKLARLKSRQKAADTRRKIIVGAIVTTEAVKEPKVARWLAATLRRNATREVDQKELLSLLAELDAKTKAAGLEPLPHTTGGAAGSIAPSGAGAEVDAGKGSETGGAL